MSNLEKKTSGGGLRQRRFDRQQVRLVGWGLIIGLIAGTLVSLYRYAISTGIGFARSMYTAIADRPLLLVPWAVSAAGIGLILWHITKWEPTSSGSGIPQVKGTVLMGLRMRWANVLVARFAGGILGSLFGLSLGREGPSVHISAAAAKGLVGNRTEDTTETRCFITGGAAAGISAAFNAPLSGIVFALEEVSHSFSAPVLLAAMASALGADVISSYVFGLTPVLDFVTMPRLDYTGYLWIAPLGATVGILGAVINRVFIGFQSFFIRLPAWAGPVLAIVIALPLGLFMPDVLGGGENLVSLAENVNAGLGLMLLLMVVKLVFSGTSFGSGVPGGIFMPIMATGALGGAAIGIAASQYDGLDSTLIPLFAALGMAGTLASSVRAPVTAILLVTEMTGSFVQLLPVAGCVLVAFLVSGLLRAQPIYDLLLSSYLDRHPEAETENGKLVRVSQTSG
ncbi:MAG: ClC family H(+)/Cl(-) exchange transporter [Candidatus Methanomethylophilus sp.]|nr:ClC family H(+)/Cl(-) exchange transporter [Methanomethylophilus sp.]